MKKSSKKFFKEASKSAMTLESFLSELDSFKERKSSLQYLVEKYNSVGSMNRVVRISGSVPDSFDKDVFPTDCPGFPHDVVLGAVRQGYFRAIQDELASYNADLNRFIEKYSAVGLDLSKQFDDLKNISSFIKFS